MEESDILIYSFTDLFKLMALYIRYLFLQGMRNRFENLYKCIITVFVTLFKFRIALFIQ